MGSDNGINAILSDLDLNSAAIKTSEFLMEVFNVFEKDKSIPGIIVTKDGHFFRMLSRTRFYESMSRQFMFELFSKRTVYSFFDEDQIEHNLFLPANTSVLTAAGEALKREERYRHDPVIVEFGNGELKLLDFYKLLLAQTHVHTQTLNLLKEANEFKKEVLGIAAHDLRNPINSVLGFSKLIVDSGINLKEIESYAEYIYTSARQMNELLNELLKTAANDATEFEIDKSTFDLKMLIESVIVSFQHMLLSKRQSINFDWDDDEIFVNADRQKINEVLENLVSNAIKYSAYDSIIRVSINLNPENIEIKVQDNGPGFSSDDLTKIFGKFQRLSAKPTGNESSTGLGLYIVKKIIDKHNGLIDVESKLGMGSTFKICLPQTITHNNLCKQQY